jgi:hypothetical protein
MLLEELRVFGLRAFSEHRERLIVIEPERFWRRAALKPAP